MSLPRFFHKRGAHNLGGRGGSMYLCISFSCERKNNDLP